MTTTGGDTGVVFTAASSSNESSTLETPTVPASVRASFAIRSIGGLAGRGADSVNIHVIRHDGTRAVLRAEHDDGRPLEWAARLCATLIGDGAVVAAPIIACSGRYVVWAGRDWTCWNFIPGTTGPIDSHRFGIIVAALHRATRGLSKKGAPECALARWARHHCPTEYKQLYESQLTGIVHSDIHLRNLISQGDTTTVIDWIDAGHGTYAGDAAASIVMCVSDHDGPPMAVVHECLIGYEEGHGVADIADVARCLAPAARLLIHRAGAYDAPDFIARISCLLAELEAFD